MLGKYERVRKGLVGLLRSTAQW